MSRRVERLAFVVVTCVLTALSFFHAISLQTIDNDSETYMQEGNRRVTSTYRRNHRHQEDNKLDIRAADPISLLFCLCTSTRAAELVFVRA